MEWTLTPFTGALVLTATEVFADVCAKTGSNLGSFLGYNALAYELPIILAEKGNGLALTNAYWNSMTNITHTFIGVYFFHEQLSNKQLAGIGLVTVGILLLGEGN